MAGVSGGSGSSNETFQLVGITLAFMAGFFVGCSLVLQKKGILMTKKISLETGNSSAYLQSPVWWMGMLCMGLGEGANFVAYAFSPAIIVAPLMAVSVVVRVAPKYGHVHPAVHLSVTAIGGAYLVVGAQGFGAAIVYSFSHWETDNQFLRWEFYPLGIFVICTAVFQIDHLNRALAHFSASIVTPLNFVFFSTSTIVTTSVLYRGFNVETAVGGFSLLLGFFVIIIGVTLLFQYNLKQNKMIMSRHIEDINDEEHDQEGTDNPFLLLSEAYPLHEKKDPLQNPKNEVKSRQAVPMSEEEYVRPEESTNNLKEIAPVMFDASTAMPLVSLSEQIQRRNEMVGKSPQHTNPDKDLREITPNLMPPEDTLKSKIGDIESDNDNAVGTWPISKNKPTNNRDQ